MFTIIDGGKVVEVDARVSGGAVRLSPEGLKAALGWELRDGALARDTMRIPMPAGAALEPTDGVDLAEVARVLDRPLALDAEEGAGYLGTAAGDRRRPLQSLQAPDFSLPDLAGRRHSLAEHRGKKILLVAYASW